MGQSPGPDWMNQWQDLSRQYLDAWQSMSRPQAPTPSPTSSWQEGFEQWSRLFSAGGGAQGETIERLIDSAKGYAAFMQSLLGAANAGSMPPGFSPLHAFGIPGTAASSFEPPMLRAMREFQAKAGQGFAQPFAHGFGAFASMPSMPGMPSMTPPDLGELKAWLSLPAFGLMREHQEHHQKMAVAWVDYQEQMGRFNTLMLKASRRGFELFEGKLSEREQPGRQIETLRALYDLWVDAAEEGYAEIALSEEFREAYAAMVNAQMRVRSQMQQEVERVCVDLGMPTRSEIDSIGERLQALRREVRQRTAGAAPDRALQRELAQLRSEVAALKASARASRPASPGPHADVASPRRRKASAKPVAKAEAKAGTRGSDVEPAAAHVAKPKRAKARKAARERGTKRAVAATATGSFASRIAKFADASLGATRTQALRKGKKKQAKADKAKNKR